MDNEYLKTQKEERKAINKRLELLNHLVKNNKQYQELRDLCRNMDEDISTAQEDDMVSLEKFQYELLKDIPQVVANWLIGYEVKEFYHKMGELV
jgi:hypothetical protein|tara:strand:+ start:180 stop:461 length:282 start_codon:yes stop_codon:yes gene_type:complete